MRYHINKEISVEHFEEGTMITLIDKGQLVCLGKKEQQLLKAVLSGEYEDVVTDLCKQYLGNGDQIRNDMKEFCDKLIELGIIKLI